MPHNEARITAVHYMDPKHWKSEWIFFGIATGINSAEEAGPEREVISPSSCWSWGLSSL